MNDEIPLRLYHNNENHLSMEEFKKMILNPNTKNNLIDRAANGYDRIPKAFRILKNFDPTGILSTVDDLLMTSKAEREQAMIIEALYGLYQYVNVIDFGQNIKVALESNKQESCALTEIYFQKSIENYQIEKIRYFRNVWYNSINDCEKSFDEKQSIFDLLSSLTLDQIKMLKYIYDQIEGVIFNGVKTFDYNTTKPIGMETFATENNLNYAYVQQNCIYLQGKGLLHPGAGTFISFQARTFVPSEYVNILIEYLNDAG